MSGPTPVLQAAQIIILDPLLGSIVGPTATDDDAYHCQIFFGTENLFQKSMVLRMRRHLPSSDPIAGEHTLSHRIVSSVQDNARDESEIRGDSFGQRSHAPHQEVDEDGETFWRYKQISQSSFRFNGECFGGGRIANGNHERRGQTLKIRK